jgi:hypothetical protein
MSSVVPTVIRTARRGAAPLLLGAAFAALPAAAAHADPTPTVSREFTTIGCDGVNRFTVPDGVATVHIMAVGGAGVVGSSSGSAAGRGAAVEGDLLVSAGQMLSLCVGSAGGGGGAAGGGAGTGGGGAGGGYSSVATTADGKVVIAGGGGGTGGTANGGGGGDAGLLGQTGASGGAGSGTSGPGGGASATIAGGGGVDPSWPGLEGLPGSDLAGGLGGSGDITMFGGGGGGGGAGAFGGGGGAASVGGVAGAGGGGGGGSSLCQAPATGCDSDYAEEDAPSVTLTYAKPAASLTLIVSPDPVERGNYTEFKASFATAPAPGATVDFAVGGAPVSGCSTVPVVATRASCWGPVPAVVGRHTATASFAGDADWDAAEATGSFDVALSSIAFPAPSPAFGDVLVDTTAPSKPVTVTNDSPFGVHIGYVIYTLRGKAARSYAPTASPRGGVRLVGADAASFRLTSDTCTSAYLAPGASCVVEVAFTPSRTGAHEAAIQIDSTAASSPHLVALTGTGTVPKAPPADPGTPSTPGTLQPEPGHPAPKPATLAAVARGRAAVARDGSLTLPITCPQGSVCSVSGTLTVAAGAFASGARSAAAEQQLLVSFRGVTIRGTAVKSLRLRIPQRFIKAAQKAGKRTVRATLTITTRRAGESAVVARQQVTLTLPKAAKAPRPVAPARRPSFTG